MSDSVAKQSRQNCVFAGCSILSEGWLTLRFPLRPFAFAFAVVCPLPFHTHTHRRPSALYILSWSDFIRHDTHGLTLLDSRTIAKVPEQSALWSASLPPHTLENIGNVELRAISVELKNTK
jgi:hypothetical protein